MSADTLNQLQSKALMLPLSERAELVHALVNNLNAPVDANVDEAWDKEVLQRLAEVDSGAARLLTETNSDSV